MTTAGQKFLDRMLEASRTNDPEKMYPLFFVLQASASEQRWTGNGYVSECNPDRLKKFLTFQFNITRCISMGLNLQNNNP
jgi:hypothetical protein